MTIVTARYQNKQVEILDTLQANGRKLAIIKAMEGQRFQSWTHGGWCESETATVRADLLQNVGYDPQPEPPSPTLIDMALKYQHKRQWHSGESVWLWEDRRNGRKHGAFLKNSDGRVDLCITGYDPSLEIFWLDLRTGQWKLSPNLKQRYGEWARKAQEAIHGKHK